MPVPAMRRLSGTCGDLGPEDLHCLPDGRDVLQLRIGHLDLEALLDGHDRAHQVDRVQSEVVEQVGLWRYRLGLDLQAVHEHLTQGLQNFLVVLRTHVVLLSSPAQPPKDPWSPSPVAPVRPRGIRSGAFSRWAAGMPGVMAVPTRPGTTTWAVTPGAATSLASDLVKPTSPAFAAA